MASFFPPLTPHSFHFFLIAKVGAMPLEVELAQSQKTYDRLGNHCLEAEEVHQVIPDIFVPVQESYQIVPWSLPLTPLVHGRFLGQSALDIRLPVNYTF